jgi:hypothetical protein
LSSDLKGPKTNAMAQAMLQSAYGKDRGSPMEAIGGLAQVLAGTAHQREFEAAEKEREELPQRQLEEYIAGGGTFDDADSLIRSRVPVLVESGLKLKAAQAEAGLKPPEREVVDGDIVERGAGGWETVHDSPEKPKSEAGQLYYEWKQGLLPDELYAQEIANRSGAPYTEVGKILGDVKRGLMSEDMGNLLIERATSGWTMVGDDPAERAALGINPNDTRSFQKSPEGKLEPIEEQAQFEDWTDENGTVWKRNVNSNEITRVGDSGDPAKLPVGWRWVDKSKGQAEIIPGIDPEFLKPGATNLTESQANSLGYYSRGASADMELAQVMADGRPLDEYLADIDTNIWGELGTVGKLLKTPEQRIAWRAGAEFLAMVVREDSGAAVTAEEWELYTPIYLPEWNDDPATIERKRIARDQFLMGQRMGLGNATEYADKVDAYLAARTLPNAPGTSAPVEPGQVPIPPDMKPGDPPRQVPGGTLERLN